MAKEVQGKVQKSVHLTTELAERLRIASFNERKPQSTILEDALEAHLKKLERRAGAPA